MATQIQLRKDSAADWTSVNPTLKEGEVGLEMDTKKFKVGDGVTAWNGLNYWTTDYPATGQIVTASLGDTNEESGVVSLFTAFDLHKIVASHYSRIRLYRTAAARDADLSRTFGDLSYVGTQHKMLLDLLLDATTGLTWWLSPVANCINGNTPLDGNIYYNIQNLSGGATAVTIDLDMMVQII